MLQPSASSQRTPRKAASPLQSLLFLITCPNGASDNVSYADDVSIDFTTANGSCGSANNGCFSETVSCISGGTPSFCTTYHSPAGVIPGNPDGSSNPTVSATKPGNMVFHRMWLIEGNTPVTGVRRITVLVTLLDQTVKPGVSVQMSMVRQ